VLRQQQTRASSARLLERGCQRSTAALVLLLWHCHGVTMELARQRRCDSSLPAV
jgi:hypothetical protein